MNLREAIEIDERTIYSNCGGRRRKEERSEQGDMSDTDQGSETKVLYDTLQKMMWHIQRCGGVSRRKERETEERESC